MRRCKYCGRPLPSDSAPQRRYCEHPDCKRERDAYRKAHERACAFNAYTRVTLESSEPLGRRRTSSSRDEKGELDWDSVSAGGGMWQAIRQAWFPLDGNPSVRWRVLPASRGPEVADQRSEVDRLMKKAEGTRPAVGQLRDASWVDTEDWGSPGALWERGERERAIGMAERERTRKLRECEALPDGYLQGGQLWAGMHLAPRQRDEEPAPRTRLSDEQRDTLSSHIARQQARAANQKPSNAECAETMGLEAGTGLSRRAKGRLLA